MSETDTPDLEQLQKQMADLAAKLEETDKERKKLAKNNQDLMAEKAAAREEAERIKLDAAKKGGDVDALEKSWADKMAAREAEWQAQLAASDKLISGLTVGQTATSLAADLFGENADLMLHHVKGRLTYEVRDGKPVVRVLDVDGNPSAYSLDDLKKEFAGNQRFGPFIVGSKASGPGPHNKGGGAVTKKFNEMSGGELAQLRRDNPQEYARLKAERDAG